MGKTIFILALFTVILSYSISKAELFLEDVELAEFEEEELGGTGKTATKKTTEKAGGTASKVTTKPAYIDDETATAPAAPVCKVAIPTKKEMSTPKKGAKTWTITVTAACTGPAKGETSDSVYSITCPVEMKED